MNHTESIDNASICREVHEGKEHVLAYLRAVKLELAVAAMNEFQVSLQKSDFEPIIDSLKEKARYEYAKGEIRSANRSSRRIRALKIFRDHGFDPEKLIPLVDLPEGYRGKILLLSFSGGVIDGMVCLRSGDEWHREILKNTEEEIQDLGFVNSSVNPAGGAFVQFKDNGNIIVWGTSDDFGVCDKEFVTELIGNAYPGRIILIRK